MITVDNLLVNLVNHSDDFLTKTFSSRDASVLQSLAQSVNGQTFITENQSRLLVKILKDHQKKLIEFEPAISEILEAQGWSHPFRKIEQVRKFYISQVSPDSLALTIEFTFSSQIRKILGSLTKKVDNLFQSKSGKIYHAELTEKNIVVLVEELSRHDFIIDETIKNHYDTIKSWSEKEVKDQFLITNITHQNFQKQITADLGIDTPIDQNVINDRRHRYQYFVEKVEKSPENLVEIIANRPRTKIWIDSNNYTIDDVIRSLVVLKRLPVLVVFDSYSSENSIKTLKELGNALDKNGIFSGVGIYFRLPNDAVGKEFNTTIAERQYNCQLDTTTKVVGVQAGKIPKFFLSNQWKPMSVISTGTALHHSKTAVYASSSDLVISFCDKQPLRFEMEASW